MPGIERFEEIEAWQKARELTRSVYRMSSVGAFAKDFALRDQMRRAAVSIMSNIAEGFERGGDREFRQFLALAKGSAGELRSQMYVALDANYISVEQFEGAQGALLHVTNLIGGFMRYLRAAEMKGHKYAGHRTLDTGHWTTQ